MQVRCPASLSRSIGAAMLGLCAMLACADDATPTLVPDPVSQGVALRQQGHLTRSIELLAQQAGSAPTERDRMRATGELGASLLQARQADRAAAALREAYRFFSGPERAPYALRLGNLASMGRRHMEARGYYEEVLQLAGGDAELSLSAALNLARLAPETERLQYLAALYPKVARVTDDGTRARLFLNLGSQAHALGQPALALAYTSYDLARQLSAQAASGRLQVEALDALAQLYEDQSRGADALVLTRQAIAAAQALAPAAIGDLMVNLEWRQARLYAALGRRDLALAAYQRAVEQVEPMRQDMPIEYDDGSSSFRRTLEPIYLGLFEGLLHAADAQTGSRQATTLRRARDVVELIKQAEMQDYLGDRCTVDAVKGGTETVIPEGTAVLYPVILGDRLELLIETGSGITHFSTRVSGALLRRTAGLFANDLRDGAPGYMARSRQIYDWLLRPVEGFMRDQRITTLVVVPDGALRLVAVGALHDGQRFVLEKFAVSTVTGLSMTNTVAPPRQAMHLLMAGISEPGPVVDKLSQAIVDELLAPAYAAPPDLAALPDSRTMFPTSPRPDTPVIDAKTNRSLALRKVLALPGVDEEVDSIGRIVRSTSMLNAPFTIDAFRREAESGTYRFVHIASHGVFGGSAAASFMLAYDDLLTLDGLQSLLNTEGFRTSPIELLSLSACETAEGDDRSPLGLSGAAIKARAKSVLGSLWPVEDTSARKTMEGFYGALAAPGQSKAQALRQSQLDLLRSAEFSHPFFWAPFVLIGNWL